MLHVIKRLGRQTWRMAKQDFQSNFRTGRIARERPPVAVAQKLQGYTLIRNLITSHHMVNTEAGLQRPLFLRNRLKTTSI